MGRIGRNNAGCLAIAEFDGFAISDNATTRMGVWTQFRVKRIHIPAFAVCRNILLVGMLHIPGVTV